MKVFLSGEGPDELGDWYHPPQYHDSPPEHGVIEVLLRKAGVSFVVIRGERFWKTIKKFRFKPPVRADHPNSHAANNDPLTWSPRVAAVAVVLAGTANGIGFVGMKG